MRGEVQPEKQGGQGGFDLIGRPSLKNVFFSGRSGDLEVPAVCGQVPGYLHWHRCQLAQDCQEAEKLHGCDWRHCDQCD